jgi:acetyltransferase-like isoleucine patch superfamily enzyme
MDNRPSWMAILRRLRWDLMDPQERKYYGYWLIWQIPGAAGIQIRARYLMPRIRKAGKGLLVQPGCRFRSLEKLELGENVTIGYDNFLQAYGGLTIGNNVAMAPGVKIWSVNHNIDDPDTAVEQQGQTQKPVVIGDNVFIASNAFILPGVTLPEGCIVSAGSVVSAKEYKPHSILAGNPARVIGYRGNRAADPAKPAAAQPTAASPATAEQPAAATVSGA